MGCHGNHEISKTQKTFIFEDNIFIHLSGPIGQIYAHNKMSDVFNLGLITPVAYYSLPMLFAAGWPTLYFRFESNFYANFRQSEVFLNCNIHHTS